MLPISYAYVPTLAEQFQDVKSTNTGSLAYYDTESRTFLIFEVGGNKLRYPMQAFVEKDEDGFIALITQVDLVGHGDTLNEAVENLKYELDSTYSDLQQDDNFSAEWLMFRHYLRENMIPA